MGMFDTLRIEQIIPGYSSAPDEEFQTKSFECFMENYVISGNGELYKEVWDWDWIDDDRHVLTGRFIKIDGTYRREYLTNFHGDIIFYTSKPMDENRMWRDYTARFTEGRLSRIWYEDKQY